MNTSRLAAGFTSTVRTNLTARLRAVTGMTALAALVTLGIVYGGSHLGAGDASADSGHETKTVNMVAPTVGAAQLGQTATWTAPPTALNDAKAVPAPPK